MFPQKCAVEGNLAGFPSGIVSIFHLNLGKNLYTNEHVAIKLVSVHLWWFVFVCATVFHLLSVEISIHLSCCLIRSCCIWIYAAHWALCMQRCHQLLVIQPNTCV